MSSSDVSMNIINVHAYIIWNIHKACAGGTHADGKCKCECTREPAKVSHMCPCGHAYFENDSFIRTYMQTFEGLCVFKRHIVEEKADCPCDVLRQFARARGALTCQCLRRGRVLTHAH